mmetsp:Transcript_83407/g.139175  ORF Transcript_83407/g.139175 Transcript_83407/m.139175 type:complete len:211 (+) Transcript_83407:807-1439(+)
MKRDTRAHTYLQGKILSSNDGPDCVQASPVNPTAAWKSGTAMCFKEKEGVKRARFEEIQIRGDSAQPLVPCASANGNLSWMLALVQDTKVVLRPGLSSIDRKSKLPSTALKCNEKAARAATGCQLIANRLRPRELLAPPSSSTKPSFSVLKQALQWGCKGFPCSRGQGGGQRDSEGVCRAPIPQKSRSRGSGAAREGFRAALDLCAQPDW